MAFPLSPRPSSRTARRFGRGPFKRLTTAGRILVPALITASLLAPSMARARDRAVIVEILDGRELYIDRKQARVSQTAQAPQQVSTRNSRGQIRFNSGAMGRLNRFSLMKLGSDCFLIDRGQILISGRQNGCTRSNLMSVRGTNYVIDVDEDGTTDVSVLEGTVVVEIRGDDTSDGRGDQPPRTVVAGQRLRLSPAGPILRGLALTSSDYNSILSGPLFRGYTAPLPAYGALESHIRSEMPEVRLPGGGVVRPSIPVRLPRLF